MYYPIAIEPGDETHAFGVVVPDLPGCFSAGDTMIEAFINVREAIKLWIETNLELGKKIPKATSIVTLRAKYPEYADWVWGVADFDSGAISITEFDNVLLTVFEKASLSNTTISR